MTRAIGPISWVLDVALRPRCAWPADIRPALPGAAAQMCTAFTANARPSPRPVRGFITSAEGAAKVPIT